MEFDSHHEGDLISTYRERLTAVRDLLMIRRQAKWVETLESWVRELSALGSEAELQEHARRTIRALGGMESIGEMAVSEQDQEFTRSVDNLYSAAKQMLST